MSSILNTPGLSFYAIPLAWALALAPHLYAISMYEGASSKKFDNTQPRSLTSKVHADQSLDKMTKNAIIRAEGAQQNGFENLGLFAAVVVAGNATGLDPGYLNLMTYGYITSRILYNAVYLTNTSIGFANFRSVVYVASSAIIGTLFINIGNQMRTRANVDNIAFAT